MVNLRLLGGAAVEGRGGPVAGVLARRHALALLALLARSPAGTVTRDRAIGLLWPESTDERARSRLRTTLHAIRSQLGADSVLSTGDDLRLNADRIRTDVVEFVALLERGELEKAAHLYAGPFLAGFHLNGPGEFERWVERERDTLARTYQHTLELLAEDAERAGEHRHALQWWERLIREQDYAEGVVLRGMHAAVAAGERGRALDLARRHGEMMREELGAEPWPEIVALARQLSESSPSSTPSRGTSTRAHGSAVPETTATIADAPTHTPEAAGARTAAVTPRVLTHISDPVTTSDSTGQPTPSNRSDRRRVLRRAVGLLVIVVLLVPAVSIIRHQSNAAPELSTTAAADVAASGRTRVLVAAFENRTSDPALGAVAASAADWLARGLSRTGLVQVIVSDAYRRSSSAARTQDTTSRTSMSLAHAVGADLVVTGAIEQRNDSVYLHAQVLRGSDASIVGVIPAIAAPIEDAGAAVDPLRQRALGALAAWVDPRLTSWIAAAGPPPSLDAYRNFANALDLFSVGRYQEALDGFASAARDQSPFPAAVIWTAFTAQWAGRFEDARPSIASLLPLRDSLPAWEAAMLDYLQAQDRQDYAGAYLALQRVTRVAPRSVWSYLLAGSAAMMGRPREALRILIDVGPGQAAEWFPYWWARVEARHRLHDFAGELEDVRRWREDSGDNACCSSVEARALVGLGRVRESMATIDSALAAISAGLGRARVLARFGEELRAHGFPDEASRVLERELQLRLAQPSADRTAGERFEVVRVLYRIGRIDEAGDSLAAVPSEIDAANRAGMGALIEIARGSPADARRLSAEWAADRNEPGLYWLAIWRARLAAALQEPDTAVNILRVAFAEDRMGIYPWLHSDPELAPLYDYPPFRAFLRPRG